MSLRIGSREFTKEQTIFLAVGAGVFLLVLMIAFGVLPGGKRGDEEINLVVWGVDDSARVWGETVDQFRRAYPNINVSYRAVEEENYESELINALAAGSGPDVFMFHSKWLTEHGNKVVPAPSNKIATTTFSDLFPQVAESDFVRDGKIYAMPLYIDTLALMYNRDIFDSKGVVFPPETWADFEGIVSKIRVFASGEITESAAAIGGTARSTPNAVDLLGLIMMQSGSPMINESGTRADFGRDPEDGLELYTRFADEENPAFTWEDSFGNANELFANEEVAMTFVYEGDVKEILDLNPYVDFSISKVPQVSITNPINFANYYGLAVSSGSQNQNVAWDFVIFAATDRVSVEKYVTETGRTPALRFLINNYLNNPSTRPLAEQALTAKSWPQPEDDAVESIFNDMIDRVINGGATVRESSNDGRTELTEIIRR